MTDVSQPFVILLHEIGDAVCSLNTCVVGLDAVEKGHQKPASLDISWNPDDRIAASRKSRKFILEATIVRVAETILEYISALGALPRFKHAKAQWNGNTPAAERISDIYTEAVGKKNYLIPASVLMFHWRNRVIHRSQARLRANEKRLLEPIRELMTHDEWVTAVRLSMMRIMASFTNATAMRVCRS